MIAAALNTFRSTRSVANETVEMTVDMKDRFEPVSRIIERCDAKSVEIARPVCAVTANS